MPIDLPSSVVSVQRLPDFCVRRLSPKLRENLFVISASGAVAFYKVNYSNGRTTLFRVSTQPISSEPGRNDKTQFCVSRSYTRSTFFGEVTAYYSRYRKEPWFLIHRRTMLSTISDQFYRPQNRPLSPGT